MEPSFTDPVIQTWQDALPSEPSYDGVVAIQVTPNELAALVLAVRVDERAAVIDRIKAIPNASYLGYGMYVETQSVVDAVRVTP